MTVNYDTEKINSALHDFYNATGITIDLLKTDFTKVSRTKYEFNKYCRCIRETPKGEKACRMSELKLLEKCKSSRKAEMHICHAGLADMAVPIIYDVEIIGYIVFGQLRLDSDFSRLEEYISSIQLDKKEMKKHYNKINFYDSDKIHSISNIASMLIKYILLENMLKPNIDKNIEKVIGFINDNIGTELNIKLICKNANMSKSMLYKKFHTYFNCTVSEYINVKRAERALEYLTRTDLSMEDISQRVGFSSSSYFSKIFKKTFGVSPLRYKKLNTGI